MKFEDIAKAVTIGGLVYAVLKGLSQPTNNANHNNPDNFLPTTPEYNPMTCPVQVPLVLHVPQVTRNTFADIDVKAIVEEAFNESFGKPTPADSASTQPKLSPDPQTIETNTWLKLIHHPLLILILGGRGKGKSALGYRLLELLRWVANIYVVGLPKEARKCLPEWIRMVASLEDVPPKSIVLVDEAYMPYHARSSMAAKSKAMSQLLNLSRQREQTLIFVTQESRQVDSNITSSANVIIFKKPGILQAEFDRPGLTKIASNAKEAFTTISAGDEKNQSYVYAPDSDFTGLVENSLPTFWTQKLSHIFAAGGEVITIAPKETPLTERIERAKQLKQQGLSQGQIAKMMGVTRPTIKNYLEGYPYRA